MSSMESNTTLKFAKRVDNMFDFPFLVEGDIRPAQDASIEPLDVGVGPPGIAIYHPACLKGHFPALRTQCFVVHINIILRGADCTIDGPITSRRIPVRKKYIYM